MIRAKNLACYASGQLERLGARLSESLTEGTVESVHQLRVSSRRLNEPLLLMAGVTSQKDQLRGRKELRRLRRAFRQVRELDVLLVHVFDAGSHDMLDARSLAQLEGILTGRRERALNRAKRRIEGLDSGSLIQRVQRIIDKAEKKLDRDKPAPLERLKRLVSDRVESLQALEGCDWDAADLHDVRLRVKRFRYCLELKQRLTGEDASLLISRAKTMQDSLGDWNDKLSAARIISGIARKNKHLCRQTSWSAALLAYAARWAQAAEVDRSNILESWPQLSQALQECEVRKPRKSKESSRRTDDTVGSRGISDESSIG